jgi:DNA-binding CsgD family transcriptional regulator
MHNLHQESEVAFSNVLGDFYIEHYHYLIVCPEDHVQSLKEDSTSPCYFIDSAVGQLKIHGKACVIVEGEDVTVEDSPHPENCSDTTTLLTDRELQIVQLIAQGRSNKQIAHRLQISEWTVSTHLRRVFAKLGVDSRAAMVYRCSSLLNQLKQLIQ